MNNLDLSTFSVTANGVIVVPGITEPTTRADVFEQVDPRDVHTCQDLIELIDSCSPLAAHFQDLSASYLQEHPDPDSLVGVRGAGYYQ